MADPKKVSGGKMPGMSQADKDRMAAAKAKREREAQKTNGEKPAAAEAPATGGGWLGKFKFWGKDAEATGDKKDPGEKPADNPAKSPAAESPKPAQAAIPPAGPSRAAPKAGRDDDSVDIDPEDESAVNIKRMFQKRLGKLTRVEKEDFSDKVDFIIGVPVAQTLLKRPADSVASMPEGSDAEKLAKKNAEKAANKAHREAVVRGLLEKAGMADETVRNALKQEPEGLCQWTIPESVLKHILPENRDKKFNVMDYIRSKPGLDLVSVVPLKTGIIVANVPISVSRDVLFAKEEDKGLDAKALNEKYGQLKKQIGVDIIVSVSVTKQQIAPALEAFAQEEAEKARLAQEAKQQAEAAKAAEETPAPGAQGTPIFAPADKPEPAPSTGSKDREKTKDLRGDELPSSGANTPPAASVSKAEPPRAPAIAPAVATSGAGTPQKTPEQILKALTMGFGSAAAQIPASEGGGYSLTFYDTDGFRNMMVKVVGNKQATEKMEQKTGFVRWAINKKDNAMTGDEAKDTQTLSSKLGVPVTLSLNGSDEYFVMGVPADKKTEDSGLKVKRVDTQVRLTLTEADAQEKVRTGTAKGF